MPWGSVEGSVVCREDAVEDVAAGGATAMPRHVAKKDDSVHASFEVSNPLFLPPISC